MVRMEQKRETPITAVAPTAWQDDVWLREFLATRNVPCPSCGYNLRGLVSVRCPECGQMLRLSVHLAEPFVAAWVAMLVGVTGSGGMAGFYIPAVLIAGWPPSQEWWLSLSILLSISATPFVPLAIIYRKRFMRYPRNSQWAFATIAIAVLLLNIVLVFAGIR